MIVCCSITGHGCHGIPPQNEHCLEALFYGAACCRISSPWYRGTGDTGDTELPPEASELDRVPTELEEANAMEAGVTEA